MRVFWFFVLYLWSDQSDCMAVFFMVLIFGVFRALFFESCFSSIFLQFFSCYYLWTLSVLRRIP